MKNQFKVYNEKFNPYNTKGTVLFARMRKFFLGKTNPPMFTRVNCNLAILYFFYIFLWALIIFIAFEFGKNLPKGDVATKLFQDIGKKYAIRDINLSFTLYLSALLVFSFVTLVGIMLVWRQKLNGYLLVILPVLICTTISLVLLGTTYVSYEEDWWEFAFGGIVLVLFAIDYFMKRKLLLK